MAMLKPLIDKDYKKPDEIYSPRMFFMTYIKSVNSENDN
jgi:hypothetical protein